MYVLFLRNIEKCSLSFTQGMILLDWSGSSYLLALEKVDILPLMIMYSYMQDDNILWFLLRSVMLHCISLSIVSLVIMILLFQLVFCALY